MVPSCCAALSSLSSRSPRRFLALACHLSFRPSISACFLACEQSLAVAGMDAGAVVLIVVPVRHRPPAIHPMSSGGVGYPVVLGVRPSLGRRCPLAPLALPPVLACAIVVPSFVPSLPPSSLAPALPRLLAITVCSPPSCLLLLLLVWSSSLLSPRPYFAVVPAPVVVVFSWMSLHRRPSTPGSSLGTRNPPCEQARSGVWRVLGRLCRSLIVVSSSS